MDTAIILAFESLMLLGILALSALAFVYFSSPGCYIVPLFGAGGAAMIVMIIVAILQTN